MKNYYVYVYKEADGSVSYVGRGQKGRAWHCGYMKGDTQERQDWKEKQIENGKLPCDWVHIVERCLSKEDANDLEKFLIEELRPKLNRMHNKEYDARRHKLDIDKIKAMRKAGMSYQKIAEEFAVAAMTVYRQLKMEKMNDQHV